MHRKNTILRYLIHIQRKKDGFVPYIIENWDNNYLFPDLVFYELRDMWF